MLHKHFSEIETARLLLRAPLELDWEVISYLRTDVHINKFVSRASAPTRIDALHFIQKMLQGIVKKDLFYWSITEKINSRIIGSICLWNFSKDGKIAETGYDLVPEYQGQGIMSEALQGVLNLGFSQLELHTIEAYTHRKNLASIKMLKSNNFELIPGKIDTANANNLIFRTHKSS